MILKGSVVVFLVAAIAAVHPQATDAPATTVAPVATTKIVPTDKICKTCKCDETKVDCRDRKLTEFFTEADWEGLLDKGITEVDLSGNSFVNVTVVPELPIQLLNLSRCSIENIATAAFRDLQLMQTLDLSWNRLTAANLNPNLFEGRYSPDEYEPLRAMRTLDLSHNDLHSLHQDLFEHLPELTELVLSDNPLKIIDQVTVIAISSLPDLKIFKMRGFQLKEIPERFLHTPRFLEHLDVSANELRAVPQELEEARNLLRLNLSRNPIEKVLKMRGCQLKEIPERFLHTPLYLEHLDVSANELRAVPQELEEARNLLRLNLNQNPIEKIDTDDKDFPAFPVLPRLEELHMCNMEKLQFIGPYALGGLHNLKVLHLTNNPKLDKIAPKALASVDDIGENYVWPQLKELYISGNNLSELDSRLVAQWDKLTALEAQDNPYMCDCTTQWMVKDLVPIVDKLKKNASSDMVCSKPPEMAGKTLQQLTKLRGNMRCADKYNHRPERDGALLLGALIGVLLAVPLVLVVMLLWRRGYFAPCGASGPAGFSRAFYKRAQTDEVNF